MCKSIGDLLLIFCLIILPLNSIAKNDLTDEQFLVLFSEADLENELNKRALLYYKALNFGTEKQQFMVKHRVAKLALEIKDVEKAFILASDLVETSKKYKDNLMHDTVLHHAYTVLGKIALLNNNIEKAKVDLIASSEISYSPTLQSFGPSMALANSLLLEGEKDVVLQYLNKSKMYWAAGENILDEWILVINNNEIPNFGANINY